MKMIGHDHFICHSYIRHFSVLSHTLSVLNFTGHDVPEEV